MITGKLSQIYGHYLPEKIILPFIEGLDEGAIERSLLSKRKWDIRTTNDIRNSSPSEVIYLKDLNEDTKTLTFHVWRWDLGRATLDINCLTGERTWYGQKSWWDY